MNFLRVFFLLFVLVSCESDPVSQGDPSRGEGEGFQSLSNRKSISKDQFVRGYMSFPEKLSRAEIGMSYFSKNYYKGTFHLDAKPLLCELNTKGYHVIVDRRGNDIYVYTESENSFKGEKECESLNGPASKAVFIKELDKEIEFDEQVPRSWNAQFFEGTLPGTPLAYEVLLRGDLDGKKVTIRSFLDPERSLIAEALYMDMRDSLTNELMLRTSSSEIRTIDSSTIDWEHLPQLRTHYGETSGSSSTNPEYERSVSAD